MIKLCVSMRHPGETVCSPAGPALARTHTVLSSNVRASGQASLPVCADTCRAFIVNFHAALRAAPPRMKARIAPCLRHSRNPAPRYVYVPLWSALNACRRHAAPDFPLPTAGLRFAPVVARRVPLARSNRPHTLGLSNVQTQGQVNLPLRLPT